MTITSYSDHPDFTALNEALIDHYECFKTERFWLDQFPKKNPYVAVEYHMWDNPPVSLQKWIAKFIARWLDKQGIAPTLIFVGPYVWSQEKLNAN
jgi:hypothetical protein